MTPVELAIMLLTVIVSILSIIIIALIVAVIILIGKIKKVTENAHVISNNVVNLTSWLQPKAVFSAAVKAFRKNK